MHGVIFHFSNLCRIKHTTWHITWLHGSQDFRTCVYQIYTAKLVFAVCIPGIQLLVLCMGGGLRTPGRCVRFDKIQRNVRKKKKVGYLQNLLQITTVLKLHCMYVSLISDIYIVYSYHITIRGIQIFRFSIATFQIIIFMERRDCLIWRLNII